MSKKRQRKAERISAVFDAALSVKCPACEAGPGVCCGYNSTLGPWMHERRYS